MLRHATCARGVKPSVRLTSWRHQLGIAHDILIFCSASAYLLLLAFVLEAPISLDRTLRGDAAVEWRGGHVPGLAAGGAHREHAPSSARYQTHVFSRSPHRLSRVLVSAYRLEVALQLRGRASANGELQTDGSERTVGGEQVQSGAGGVRRGCDCGWQREHADERWRA
jgi:hypothetical protein